MKASKIGRPTECVKEEVIKARVDSELKEKLESCAKMCGCSKLEILRIEIKSIETIEWRH